MQIVIINIQGKKPLFISHRSSAMKIFTKKYKKSIAGIIESFDRIVFKGHLPLANPNKMMYFMSSKGVLFKDFGDFVKGPAETLKKHAMETARKAKRPYIYLNYGRIRKEEKAREIAEKDGIKKGLVCVFSALEACYSFRLKYGKKRPFLKNETRKCLCLYYYIIDPDFGLLHIRIQTWFPFTVQICLNGHGFLARRMDAEGVDYIRDGNCFIAVDDFEKAGELAGEFHRLNWPDVLSKKAELVNPLFSDILSGMAYYWVVDQAEFATDIVFKPDQDIEPLYEKFLEYAITRFGAQDVLTFLGKKLDGRFKGEQFNICRKRQPGARVRHWVKRNWIKMYNKSRHVVRVETVINHPYDFRIYRNGIRKGKPVKDWFPMSKRVTNLYRYREIAQSANNHYIDALAVQIDPRPSRKDMKIISQPVNYGERRLGGFNPADKRVIDFFAEVMRAEYLVKGFQNVDVREALYGVSNDKKTKQREASRVWRLFKKLHVRKLIAKIPKTRRWRITSKGSRILGAFLAIFRHEFALVAQTV